MIKKLGIYAGTAGLMLTLLAPVALAQGRENSTSTRGNTAANLCVRVTDQVVNLVTRVSDRVGRVESTHTYKVNQLNDVWNKFDGEQKNSRSQEDAGLSARFPKLEEMGKTDAQKQAISAFEVAVRNALQAKRAALDAAMKIFRDGVDKLMTFRSTVVSNNLSQLKNEFQAAADKVRADCAAGTNAKTVRTNFLSAIKLAEKSYDASKSVQDSFVSQMKTLTDGKKAALDKAQNDFKSAMDQARVALNAVLGSTATSTNP